MFNELINSIQSILEDVSELAYIYNYPIADVEGYPSAIFYPVGLENSYLTSTENAKIYKFKIWIVTEMQIKDKQTAFNTILSTAVDAVIAQFDADWSISTIEGHRTWALIENGDWSVVVGQDGEQGVAELNLTIKSITIN